MGLPLGFAPEALAEKTQARKWSCTSGNFCKPRARWPGRNCEKPLKFCAPEGHHPPKVVTLVMGSGESGLWT